MKNKTGFVILLAIAVAIAFVALYFRTSTINKDSLLNENRTTLIKTLPYEGEDFVVDYIVTSKTITIRIYADPADKKKQAAFDYIKSFGINPDQEQIDIFLGPDVVGGSSGP